MAEAFDPYHEWLGIAPEDQPPDLYRLLGIRTFEDKPSVIESAADQRMGHLRTFQAGKRSAQSQKLLNQVSSARVTLLNPEKKAKYDELLRERMRLEAEGSVLDDKSASRHEELSTTLVGFLEAMEVSKLKEAAGEKAKPADRKPTRPGAAAAKPAAGGQQKLIIGSAIGAGVLLVLVLVAVFAFRPGGDGPKEKPQPPGDWISDGGQQSPSSTPTKPTDPKPAIPTTGPGEQPAKLPVSVQAPEGERELTVDLPGGVKMEFIQIPAGEFMMGDANGQDKEKPVHKVTISKPFYLGKYEVTQAQWEAVMGNNPSKTKAPMNPVGGVSWNDVQAFLAKVNTALANKGMEFRQPTEAQWEYACRAGTTTAFCFGDDPALLAQHAWSKDNSEGKMHPVGRRKPNAWGLYDMHGNVMEWCSDKGVDSYYANSPPVDPVGPRTGAHGVLRGGHWNGAPENCRSAHRSWFPLDYHYNFLGFRLALVRSGGATEPVTGQTVDLLKLIDPKQDTFKGEARFEHGVLVLPGHVDRAGVRVRYKPPEEYVLTVVAQRKTGNDSLALGLVVGDHQVGLSLDGWMSERSQLSLIDGQKMHIEGHGKGHLFRTGEPLKIVCAVRKTGIHVTADDKELIDYNGDFNRLSLREEIWQPGDKRSFFVGSYKSTYHVSKMTLAPLGGSGPAPKIAPTPTEIASGPEPVTPTETRLPVPPPAEQQEKIKQLNEVYDFSKRRTPPERLKLANELYAMAKKYKGGSAEKFVLLRNAMEFARTGGDAKLMLEVVDTMGADFQVSLLPAKQKVLADFVSGTPNTDQIGAFIRAADPVIDQALGEGRYDIAMNIVDAAYRLSQQNAGREFRKQTYDRRKEVQKLAASWKTIQDAQAVLKTNPEDAAANLTVGRWLCFERNDWRQGLPLLAKCSSPALQGPAHQETRSPPTTPDTQVALADAWWDVAEKAKGKEKNALMLHAGEWYTKANAGLPEGFVKVKVKKRLEEIGQVAKVAVEEPSKPSHIPEPSIAVPSGSVLLLTFERETVKQDRGHYIIKDQSGNGNDGKVIGAKWSANGIRGGACEFDGVDDYIDCGNADTFNTKGPITISLWMNLQKWDSDDGLCAKGPSHNESWLLDVQNDRLRFARRAMNNRSFHFANAKAPVVPNKWHHVVAIDDGNSLRLYVDMEESISKSHPKVSQINDSVVAIGTRQSPGGQFDKNVRGMIDEFAIWPRALSIDEVKVLHERGKRESRSPRPKPPSPRTGTSKLPKELSVDLPGGVKMEFVLIPAGEFMMGSSEKERQLALEQAKADNDKRTSDKIPSEGPQHRVKISKPFYLGKYEVTQAQWQAVMGNNPSEFKAPTNPVERVSWDDIQPFLAKLNVAFGKKGMVFGLPTEAGWEYACRAGTTTAFCFGDSSAMLPQYGWCRGNAGGKPHSVGQAKPNAWGLYDMHGNVWEWCSDWHAKDFYAQSPLVDPVGPLTGSRRVIRGGSWYERPVRCRSALRIDGSPGGLHGGLGFRLALVLGSK